MKASKYNVYLLLENGDFLLYNSLSDKQAVVDSEMRDAITDCTIEDKELETSLLQCGFIVEDHVDELKIVRSRRREAIARNFCEQVGVTFVLTYGCNLACTYCYEQGVRSLGGMMSKKTIDTIMEFMRKRIDSKHSSKRVVSRLYGGEPLLNWEGCAYILNSIEGMTQERGIKKDVSLVTNATLFTDSMWEVLSSFGLEKLQITLDGCKEDHNKRRITPKGEGTYELIMENIDKAITCGIIPEVRLNLDEENYKRAGIVFDDLKERGYNQLRIQVGIVSGLQMHCPSDRTTCLNPTALAEVLPFVWNEAEIRGFEIAEELMNRQIFCQFDLLDFYVIDPFLDVYKCWDFIGMKEHKIGKISDSTFIPEYQYFDSISRVVTQFNGCSECDILPLCMGSCAARAYDNFETYHAPGCFQERYLIERKLRQYIMKKGVHP